MHGTLYENDNVDINYTITNTKDFFPRGVCLGCHKISQKKYRLLLPHLQS